MERLVKRGSEKKYRRDDLAAVTSAAVRSPATLVDFQFGSLLVSVAVRSATGKRRLDKGGVLGAGGGRPGSEVLERMMLEMANRGADGIEERCRADQGSELALISHRWRVGRRTTLCATQGRIELLDKLKAFWLRTELAVRRGGQWGDVVRANRQRARLQRTGLGEAG